MPRYKLTVEYNGILFCGWQSQKNLGAVQDILEASIRGFCGQDVRAHAAGRTDAGVHSLGQIVHIDLAHTVHTNVLRDAINAHLRPYPVAIIAVEEVSSEFKARFSAIRRHYLYRIVNRCAPLTFDRGRAWLVRRPLDTDAMHIAAQSLIGKHDFTTFRSLQCQAKSPKKTLDELTISRYGSEIEIIARARSFLHNQVRSIVGSLKLVGDGRWNQYDLERALQAKDRTACGPVAPPYGLYLLKVDYD